MMIVPPFLALAVVDVVLASLLPQAASQPAALSVPTPSAPRATSCRRVNPLDVASSSSRISRSRIHRSLFDAGRPGEDQAAGGSSRSHTACVNVPRYMYWGKCAAHI